MKPTIIVEGITDVAILRAILPQELCSACNLMPTAGRSTIVSIARTHLIKFRAPTAVVLDTDTLDATVIAETVQTTRHLMGSVAGDTAFDIIYCVPHIEMVFFEHTAALQRLFPQFGRVFIPQFAKTQPKEQLEILFQQGGGPKNLSALLDHLTSADVEQLRGVYAIQHVMAFITNNAEIPASRP